AGLLVQIDNGLGAQTGIQYESTTDLDAVAPIAWATHAPSPTYVATKVVTSVIGSTRTARRSTVTYEYADPAWDGWRRGLRGFAKVRVTSHGDGAERATIVDTEHNVSPCHQLPLRVGFPATPGAAECRGERTLDDDPYSVTEGWPVVSTIHDGSTRLS